MGLTVAKYCSQAIISYLGGDIKRFNSLKNKAMELYLIETNKKLCSKCGHIMVRAKIKNKYYFEDIYLCTSCGLAHGKRIENIRRYKAC